MFWTHPHSLPSFSPNPALRGSKEAMEDCMISAVSLAELTAKLSERGFTTDEITQTAETLSSNIKPFDAAQAIGLWIDAIFDAQTRSLSR